MPQHCPQVALKLEANWGLVSYSGLSPHGDFNAPYDYDREPEEDAEADEAADGIFALKGGVSIGNAWHRILENIDFTRSRGEWRQECAYRLAEFGILPHPDPEAPPVELTLAMLENVLNAPLENLPNDPVRLCRIARGKRLSELEFCYRFKRGFTASRLRELLAPYVRERFGMADWPEWERAVSGGYLNGIIDLVFESGGRYYILDWKPNRLRGVRRNFESRGLRRVMADSFYFMQYLIYTLALVKYLRLRLGRFGEREYDELFGGVFYLFLRGLAPERPGSGVFYEKPPYRLIEALEEVIG